MLQERPTPVQEPTTYFCNPDFKLPTLTKAAVAAPEDATAVAVASRSEKTYDFNFGGTESIHFFWGLQRMSEEELRVKGREQGCERWRFNVEYRTLDNRVILLGSRTLIYKVSLPNIVNTVPLEKGDRLILEIAKVLKTKNDSSSRKSSWQSDTEGPKPNKQKKAKASASTDVEVL